MECRSFRPLPCPPPPPPPPESFWPLPCSPQVISSCEPLHPLSSLPPPSCFSLQLWAILPVVVTFLRMFGIKGFSHIYLCIFLDQVKFMDYFRMSWQFSFYAHFIFCYHLPISETAIIIQVINHSAKLTRILTYVHLKHTQKKL